MQAQDMWPRSSNTPDPPPTILWSPLQPTLFLVVSMHHLTRFLGGQGGASALEIVMEGF